MEVLRRKNIEIVESEQKWMHTPLEKGRACIYAGVCVITRKIYVGQHLYDRGKRNRSCWDRRIVRKRYETKCTAIYNAVNAHGEDAFEWFILCECEESLADTCEITFIRWCDCISPKGYNIRCGGSRGRLHPDSIAKMKASNTFEKRSRVSKEVANRPEVKAALSARMKGKKPGKITAETEKLRRANIKKTAALKRELKAATMLPNDAIAYLARCAKERSRVRKQCQKK